MTSQIMQLCFLLPFSPEVNAFFLYKFEKRKFNSVHFVGLFKSTHSLTFTSLWRIILTMYHSVCHQQKHYLLHVYNFLKVKVMTATLTLLWTDWIFKALKTSFIYYHNRYGLQNVSFSHSYTKKQPKEYKDKFSTTYSLVNLYEIIFMKYCVFEEWNKRNL